jgi:predicted NUDIX family NTP pyrophosphohydrolase
MPKTSAGILVYRQEAGGLEVFLVHPGGPFWAKKDLGAWSIPKGEFTADEDPLEAAVREFGEETGTFVKGDFIPLNPLKQPSGKTVFAWALKGDLDSKAVRSNTFSMEWPPGSGRQEEFPEVDRAGWFPLNLARKKLLKGQIPFLDQLEQLILGRLERSGGS